MWALLSALCFISLLGAILCLIYKPFRQKAKWVGLISFLGLIISALMFSEELDESARQKGFLSATDLRAAEEAGIADPVQWREKQQSIREAEIAAIEAEMKAKADAETRRQILLRPPFEQTNFINAVERARIQFQNGQNDLQRGYARPSRAKAICTALPTSQLRGWIGTIAKLSTNGDGDGVVTIKIAEKIHLVTWNNSLSDYGFNTLIKADSVLYQSLLAMKVGDPVRIYGTMFSSGQDCYHETSLTMAGSLDAPAFLVRFLQIEPVAIP